MIAANELRIGNWVKLSEEEFSYKGDGMLNRREFKIKGFNDGSGRAGCEVICFWEIPTNVLGSGICHSGSYDADIEPIPLTPEILEKAGFAWNEEYEVMAYRDTAICYYHHVDFCFKFGLDSDLTIASCEYVHEFQNLMFSLRKEEIIILL